MDRRDQDGMSRGRAFGNGDRRISLARSSYIGYAGGEVSRRDGWLEHCLELYKCNDGKAEKGHLGHNI